MHQVHPWIEVVSHGRCFIEFARRRLYRATHGLPTQGTGGDPSAAPPAWPLSTFQARRAAL